PAEKPPAVPRATPARAAGAGAPPGPLRPPRASLSPSAAACRLRRVRSRKMRVAFAISSRDSGPAGTHMDSWPHGLLAREGGGSDDYGPPPQQLALAAHPLAA